MPRSSSGSDSSSNADNEDSSSEDERRKKKKEEKKKKGGGSSKASKHAKKKNKRKRDTSSSSLSSPSDYVPHQVSANSVKCTHNHDVLRFFICNTACPDMFLSMQPKQQANLCKKCVKQTVECAQVGLNWAPELRIMIAF
jgi:hypothetical protein